MQYNNKLSISNRPAATFNTVSRAGLCPASKALLFSALAATTVALNACSDSLTSGQPDTTFETASKPYAKALTPEAKQVVISAMEQERDLRQKAAAADKSAPHGAAAKAQN